MLDTRDLHADKQDRRHFPPFGLAQLRSMMTPSSGARRLDSPDGSREVQGAVAPYEGGDVLGQDHAFLVGRCLSQEGGELAKGRAELGFQRIARCLVSFASGRVALGPGVGDGESRPTRQNPATHCKCAGAPTAQKHHRDRHHQPRHTKEYDHGGYQADRRHAEQE
jgi:hypothetical protein